MITSPYNFVPLSEKVVMPFWAKHVSHDMPFADSVSGILKIKMTAKSPIYVRNGAPASVGKDSIEYQKFNHIGNRPFVPAASIKGMLRSVVEIMSFGRMGNKVNDHKYSVRDFQNKAIYPMETFSKDILCGWLYTKNGEYFLEDCGKPGRIAHSELDALTPTKPMSNYYKIAANITSTTKSARAKYTAFPFPKSNTFIKDRDDMGRPIYILGGTKQGTIVFSGQPGVRKEPSGQRASGKHLEFIFFNNPVPNEQKVSDEVIKNFFFAYYDHDQNQAKEDWKWRKSELDKGQKIPVFFRKEAAKIKDMGLSFLYKITYENSIKDSIDAVQKKATQYDLAETIFGYTEGVEALKGRVHISHAFSNSPIQTLPLKKEVLSGPKASYYPNYVEQGGANGQVGSYATFMDSQAAIRGWKRYPIRHGGIISNPGTENVSTAFIPLDAGAEFTFDICYHNLRKEELGALISAITFHNTEGLFHSLGMAKPLGYGKITLSIEGLNNDLKMACLKAYETFMDCALEHSTPLWFQLPQIKELFAMAKGSTDAQADKQLEYMKLDDFVNAKGRRQNDPQFSLQRFSSIAQYVINVQSLSNAADIQATKAKFEKEKQVLAAQNDVAEQKRQTYTHYEADLKKRFEEKKAEILSLLATKQIEKRELEQQQREEEQRKKKQELVEAGGQTDLVFKGLEYEQVADVVKNHLKKYKLNDLTDAQKEQLKKALADSYQTAKNPKKDTWLKKGNKFNEFPWTDIRKWLGEDMTQVLYAELIINK